MILPVVEAAAMPLSPVATRLVVALALGAALAGPAAADAWTDAGVALGRKDYAAALALLKPLAESGHARAQTKLGSLYYQGHGVAESNEQARGWFERAARQGDAEAQFQLGNMHAYGHAEAAAGEDPMRLAAQWYFAAARQGHADAQYSLAILFLAGSGVAANPAEARKWFERAAEQGHADARAYLRDSRGGR
jgi:TPR repeat protein